MIEDDVKYICPDAPGGCKSLHCYHKNPHQHIDYYCDTDGKICGHVCEKVE